MTMHTIIFHNDSLQFSDTIPTSLPDGAFLWVVASQTDLQISQNKDYIVQAIHQWGGGSLLPTHANSLMQSLEEWENQPSIYQDTALYDVLFFKHLVSHQNTQTKHHFFQTQTVGLLHCPKLLVSIHPPQCQLAKAFVTRFAQDAVQQENNTSSNPWGLQRNRLPNQPVDLMLRMLNVMVDVYFLEVRKNTLQSTAHWQNQLLLPKKYFEQWHDLMTTHNQLLHTEELCEEQQDAIQEWIDVLQEHRKTDVNLETTIRTIERCKEIMVHTERVNRHVSRLGQSMESNLQIYFATQGNRTNDIMQTLTVLTAIFLPLNLITGFFGMNFEKFPLLRYQNGLWWTMFGMVLITVVLSWFFWRKRYLAHKIH